MQTLETLIASNKENFIQHFAKAPLFVAYAPGRINIIGEHTDYMQGLSLPSAINRWVTVSMSPSNNKQVRIISTDFEGEIIFELGESYTPKSSWEKYIYGCILLFRDSTPALKGFHAVVSGNVLIGSGVSSSAALEVAFMNALNYFSEAAIDNLTLIKLCQKVEHQYLQVKSGLLDQYASQFSISGKVLLLDFQKLSHEYIPAELEGYTWILCDSKVKRALAGSKYSERVEEVQSALSTLQKENNEIDGFRDIKEKHIPFIKNLLQRKRIKHLVTENKRVEEAVEAIKNNNMEILGNLITASHYSLKDDYEVSCDELDFLMEEALKTGYCIGSRMMGGGFGGCTINLVKKGKVTEFSNKIRSAYKQRFNVETEINRYTSVNGAGIYTP